MSIKIKGGRTETRYAYTLIEAPSGIAIGTITPTSIQVQSIDTPSGLTRGSSGLMIENTTNSTTSGWKQDNGFWTSNPLSPNTLYSFRARAKNGDAIETSYSPAASTYTLAHAPGLGSFSNATYDCIQINWTANGNPAGTMYFLENVTDGTSSGWIISTSWTNCGLPPGTTYSFRGSLRGPSLVILIISHRQIVLVIPCVKKASLTLKLQYAQSRAPSESLWGKASEIGYLPVGGFLRVTQGSLPGRPEALLSN